MVLFEKLRVLRKRTGLSQMELAEKLRVSRQDISNWEAGTTRPSIDNIHYLSKLYNIPLEILLDDDAGVAYYFVSVFFVFMSKKMKTVRTVRFVRADRTAPGHCTDVTYLTMLTI